MMGGMDLRALATVAVLLALGACSSSTPAPSGPLLGDRGGVDSPDASDAAAPDGSSDAADDGPHDDAADASRTSDARGD